MDHESKSPLKFILAILIICSCLAIVAYPLRMTAPSPEAGQGLCFFWQVIQ
jgi:hypothetical protein